MFCNEFSPISGTFGLGCGIGMGNSRLGSRKGACLSYWKEVASLATLNYSLCISRLTLLQYDYQSKTERELRSDGLDVFENEPDVPQELFLLVNVALSPHCAVATLECFDALEELITANLKAFFSNKLVQSVVEF
ncbi:hypothetical protein F3Y22_tig00116996pilonHSYRG00498 [Hibiscus syriacus]|uniref:D-isomer specific 2-hydroxyacid dehydrogenase NAD-binding domain-containing protein n=1 Tax=Hibiscus syriacus TaxID=106335 RepID=A0A6A2WG13_HIBSY|nr:hypothetical protein F3Y22_tig00116996pilonHSYRG00498 [Hibiscus syriacus]